MKKTADYFIEGQKAVEQLERDVAEGNVKQSYVFAGAAGIGKRTAAKKFAMAALCTAKSKKPCGECHNCRMFEAGTHPDVKIIDDSPINIKTVREINDEMYVKPLIAQRKVFIIENADTMNAAAQNAFLKSFEEPPSYALIILAVTSVQNLLPTILSRGTRINFVPFSEDEIKKYATEKYGADAKKAEFAAQYSAGIVGRAEEIMEKGDFFEKRDALIRAIAKLSPDKMSIYAVLDAMEAGARKMPNDAKMYFEIFIGFFRDVAAAKSGGRIINSDYEDVLKEFAGKVKGAAARKIVKCAAQTISELNVSMRYDLWMTEMMINCWEDIYGNGSGS